MQTGAGNLGRVYAAIYKGLRRVFCVVYWMLVSVAEGFTTACSHAVLRVRCDILSRLHQYTRLGELCVNVDRSATGRQIVAEHR